jgi:DNA primase
MPGYLPKASLWEDHETETRFLIVRELPEDLAGENTESVDDMLEEDDPNIAENLRGRKPDENQCLYYIYAWHEPKNHLEGSETKKQLEAAALNLAKKFPGQTVREVYNELLADYLREEAEEKCIQCDVKLPSGGRFSKKGLGPFCPACYKHEIEGKKVEEDTEKVKGGYENIGPHKKTSTGKKRKHHKFASKHAADQQRKAMFARGYKSPKG